MITSKSINNEGGNVIQFADHLRPFVKYRETLQELADMLETTSEELFEAALELALTGKWKKWDDSIPIGLRMTFSEDMLLDTGDEFATEAMNLRIAMSDLAEKIHKRITA